MKNTFSIQPITVEGLHEYERIPRIYPFYAFAFIMEGEALVEIDGKNVLIGPGQLCIVPENTTYLLKYFKDTKGYDGFFTLDFLKDASYPILRTQGYILQSFWFDDAVFLAALNKRMLTAYEDKDKTFLQSGLDLILGQLRVKSKVAAVPEKFLQLVFDGEKAPLTVSEYAEILNVTANYLNKSVKMHTRRTAIDWIEIARINLAKKLLRDRRLPIVEVAVQSGLDDQSYFSRFFKKKTGMTPSEYRKSLK